MYDYLKGLGILFLMIAYPALFNWVAWRFSKEKLWDNNYGIFGAIFIPYIVTVGAIALLLVPLVIGKSF